MCEISIKLQISNDKGLTVKAFSYLSLLEVQLELKIYKKRRK